MLSGPSSANAFTTCVCTLASLSLRAFASSGKTFRSWALPRTTAAAARTDGDGSGGGFRASWPRPAGSPSLAGPKIPGQPAGRARPFAFSGSHAERVPTPGRFERAREPRKPEPCRRTPPSRFSSAPRLPLAVPAQAGPGRASLAGSLFRPGLCRAVSKWGTARSPKFARAWTAASRTVAFSSPRDETRAFRTGPLGSSRASTARAACLVGTSGSFKSVPSAATRRNPGGPAAEPHTPESCHPCPSTNARAPEARRTERAPFFPGHGPRAAALPHPRPSKLQAPEGGRERRAESTRRQPACAGSRPGFSNSRPAPGRRGSPRAGAGQGHRCLMRNNASFWVRPSRSTGTARS